MLQNEEFGALCYKKFTEGVIGIHLFNYLSGEKKNNLPPAACVEAAGLLPRQVRCWDLRGRTPAGCAGQVTPCYSELTKTKRLGFLFPTHTVCSSNTGKPDLADGVHHLLVMWKHIRIQLSWMYNATQRQGLWPFNLLLYAHVSMPEAQTWDKERKKWY